jgi:hypothetical protein
MIGEVGCHIAADLDDSALVPDLGEVPPRRSPGIRDPEIFERYKRATRYRADSWALLALGCRFPVFVIQTCKQPYWKTSQKGGSHSAGSCGPPRGSGVRGKRGVCGADLHL